MTAPTVTADGPTTAQTNRALLRTLSVWGGSCLAVGSALALASDRTAVRAFGRQTAAWGAINTAIAGFGAWRSRSVSPSADRLQRTLTINSGLDVGYIAGGVWLLGNGPTAHRRFPQYPIGAAAGDGSAVVVQGAFLLVLDSFFARRLSSASE